jgi:hypothetical protein
MIQSSCELADRLLEHVLAMTPWTCSGIFEARARPDHEADWRLQVDTEDDSAE